MSETESTEDKTLPEEHQEGLIKNVSSKKKRKKKAKNKYKELNLQQKKASGRLDEQLLAVQKPAKEENANNAGLTTDVKENKKQLNRKRKLDDVETLRGPSKKQKLSNDMEDGLVIKKAKNARESYEVKSLEVADPQQLKSKQVEGKFKLDKLKTVLEKSAKLECDARNLEVVEKPTENAKKSRTKVKARDNDLHVKSGTLRDRVVQKLASARFRYINENLYNMTSKEAVDMFKEDREAFEVYHEGYSMQVSKWPVNPVDQMIEYINSKETGLVVADLGCGEAKIAQSVKDKTVHSFDLVALNNFVTVCDISRIPLPNSSVDIGVFCLSLMGTNLVGYLCEANRVLKWRGTLLIAEVVSRFEKIGDFIRKMRKLGFQEVQKDDSNKMFVWFEFVKVNNPPKKEKRPKIELLSCVYKKR